MGQKYDINSSWHSVENRFLSGTEDFYPDPKVNQALLTQWENTDEVKKSTSPPDFSKIFEAIQEKIPDTKATEDTNPSLQEKRTVFRLGWIYAAAAIILGVLLLGGLAWKARKGNLSFGNLAEVSTSSGEKKEVILPDGSKVWLNADSKISFQEKFDKKYRKVKLIGEAYFDVTKNPEWPFFVETSQLSIRVLGTKFNVKAYKEDKIIETTLESGLISLQGYGGFFKKDNTLLVKPQQKATLSINDHHLSLENVDSRRYTSWKEGKLVFDNEEIHQAIKKLERWYGLKIKMLSDTRNDHITLTITHENIAEAIKLLQYTTASGFMVEKINTKEKTVYKYEPRKVENK